MGDLRKVLSGLFTTAESKMSLDDVMKFLSDLKAKGVPGEAIVSFVAEVDGQFSEFGGLGTVNMSGLTDKPEKSHLFINLKR